MEEEQVSYMLVKIVTTRSGKSSTPVDYNYIPKEWSDADMIKAFQHASYMSKDNITLSDFKIWLTEYKQAKQQ